MTDEEQIREMYIRWQLEDKYGIKAIANVYKDYYKKYVLKRLIKSYHWYREELMQFETIILN